jgi:hypothetical protein
VREREGREREMCSEAQPEDGLCALRYMLDCDAQVRLLGCFEEYGCLLQIIYVVDLLMTMELTLLTPLLA